MQPSTASARRLEYRQWSTNTSETWADVARKPPRQVARVIKQENQNARILVGNKNEDARDKKMRATRATASNNNVKSFERSFFRNNPSE